MKYQTKHIAEIGLSIAVLIVGGYILFMVSTIIAISGFKFILMAPYLSLVMAIVISRIKTTYIILKFNLAFAIIMFIINPFMGLSILITGILTELTSVLFSKGLKALLASSIYSGYVVIIALIISKLLIGGELFKSISNTWILLTFFIASILGLIGSRVGLFIGNHIGGGNE